MTDPEADTREADEETARRRDEALRRLLNTPPRPRKGTKAAGKGKPGNARTSPGSRSGQKVKERGEGQQAPGKR
jgi:hypothetical protein